MKNLVDYSDEEEEDHTKQDLTLYENNEQKQFKPSSILVSSTPEVSIDHLLKKKEEERAVALSRFYQFAEKKDNHLTGNVEAFNINEFVFSEQFHKFQSFGYAHDPNERNRRILVDPLKQEKVSQIMQLGFDVDAEDNEFNKNALSGVTREEKLLKQKIKSERQGYGDASTGAFNGPWGGYSNENFKNLELTQEQKDHLNFMEEKRKQKIEELKQQESNFVPYMEQHVQQIETFGGRQFIAPPPELKNVEHTCYNPKRCIHTYKGHTKGVQVIRLFPKFGHLLLSGGLDNKIKMWDVMGQRQCVRTYHGHSAAVRDLNFSNDGRHFLSASYDKSILYWDTEYGKVQNIYYKNIRQYPYCVKLNPDPQRQTLFLLGSTNKKIGQYDLRTGHRTQQYDEHLAAVNTITYFNYNRKFVSSSDDKKLFVWEFGIPVVIKHISEPEMHAVTATAMHPNQMHWAGQQSDNQIVIYDTKAGNFRLNRKKKFRGHVSAGYACGLTFSPDGQFLASGDSEGRVYIWDWKTCKNYRTLQAHDNVCIGVEWHPIEPSKFVTCGWDGLIKLWD